MLDDTRSTVVAAQAVHQDRPDDPIEYPRQDVRRRVRLLLELASAAALDEHRFPNGLANSSGLVGRYMNGHRFIQATANIDDQTFPGQNMTHSLISRQYFRCATDKPFVRHDTRVWESSAGRDPRLRAPDGKLLLGDELMADWRSRTKGSSVRLRAYVDVHPSADSRLTLDASKNEPLRRSDAEDRASLRRGDAWRGKRRPRRTCWMCSPRSRRPATGASSTPAKGTISIIPAAAAGWEPIPRPASCDSYGRTHDHDNLFVVGAPTTPTGGCTNGTLTFVALTLRSAQAIAQS